MLLSQTQKLEDIIKGLGLWETHRTYKYQYPYFPDENEEVGDVCQRLILLISKINQITDKAEMIERIKECNYSITTVEKDPAAPSMEKQKEEFEKRKSAYEQIIDEIHKLVTRK
ncbi:hypothetical protein [Marinifilum flexuosum]|uniref:hypothetical protein n=1 Tax=Marinifilum flexuosum TaxID=1117708 RepID=UPI002494C351|nr:hypothetical protein [Marinifilum flexuosum]